MVHPAKISTAHAARGNVVIRGIRERDQQLPGSGHQSIPLSENVEILRLEIDGCQGLSVCPDICANSHPRAGYGQILLEFKDIEIHSIYAPAPPNLF